jgi:methylmalonyl-CoA/ethylmalonyl-CoA epimerase
MKTPEVSCGTMVLDHVGIVVRSIAVSIEHWTTVMGYRQVTGVVTNTRQGVRVVFLAKPGSLSIKLLEPAAATSPVSALASRGGGLHHLCFRCSNVAEEVARLSAAGLRVITPPEPGEVFGGRDIAFVYLGDGVSLELIDTDVRTAVILGGDHD